MSSSNPNPNNNAAARRGYPAGDSFQHSQGNYKHHQQHHSGLRRSHIYGSRGATVFNSLTAGDADTQLTTRPTSATYSRIDGARTNPPHTRTSLSQPTLPTAGEYFAREATTTTGQSQLQSQSPVAPWARPGSRFASKQIRSAHATSSYGLPPTPESDVSVTTPPRQHRDYQFNVEMMQRMTQHAKISPLNHYDHLKRELAEENLVVDNGNVDRLVARAGERIRGQDSGTPAEQHYTGAHGRRVAFRSPEAVEGAREASRRLNGLSGAVDRPSSLYEVASKPAEPNPTSSSNMYDELKRTLSESSSERPKRIVRQPTNARQLPPLSPVQKRHVEVRPRRPVATAASIAHAPSPSKQKQNEYYQQETRPRTAPTSQDDPITNIDWLAAAQDVVESSPRKTSGRRRPRTLSSGTPLSNTAWSSRQADEFGGELKVDSTDVRPSASHAAASSKPSRAESQPATLRQLPSAALSNSYLQHNLVDFVSEDDLTLNLSSENKPPVAFESGLRSTQLASTNRRPATSSGKLQDVSFLESTKKTDPDETLDTLRQLSRLLSGNTPAKQEQPRRMAELPSEPADIKPTVAKLQTAAETRQPYKRQARPLASMQVVKSGERANQTPKAVKTEPSQGVSLTSVLNSIAKKNKQQDLSQKPGASSTSTTKPPGTRKASDSQTPTSKTIQFEDGYETDDSLDRLLTNDTDYNSLLKPAAFEDESFLQGTVQVAKQSQPQKPNDLEALALRTKVLNNLQTVQLDIRETRRGLENIERKFGMLEEDSSIFKPAAADTSNVVVSGGRPILAPRRYVFVPRKKKATKGLFRRPWVFKDYFFAFVFLVLGLLLIEYKLWSDTIIPQYSRVSSDEWFAKHPVGSYRPGGTFRAVFRVFLWFGNVGLFFLQQVSAGLLWARSGVSWLQDRVTTAASPMPADYQIPPLGAELSRSTCAPKSMETSLSP
ncbi:hypothetical protein TWF696_008208 [Orbilia brochopaga]|uniref:Uncharacterized protein n=1 Tax=Orbilia brochopaga TaxID=3140254 RepID=A0AAV9UII3_9PEZI